VKASPDFSVKKKARFGGKDLKFTEQLHVTTKPLTPNVRLSHVTPDLTADSIAEPIRQPPSTAGMTTKVVKGSMWTLGGSVLPLAVSFISTPFIIRFLGSESYGVLLLVGLIPTYFSFADFGMGIASTKFASEAYGQGNEKKEAEVVWTAAAIAAATAMLVALPIFLFSYSIVAILNVPDTLLDQASIALKITSVSFVLGVLGSVLNSPMAARLRMDLNTITGAVPRILLAVITPFIFYLGGDIVDAVWCVFIIGLATFGFVFYFSGRLLPELFRPVINRDLIRPLLKFGSGWILAMIAAMLLVNFEKLALTRMVSVKSLAYYSVAFTFANMAATFSTAMLQSLVPAFSQLLGPGKKREFNGLFVRAMRLNIIFLFPSIAVMAVGAKPFFSLWAGPEFAAESTIPFYFLLAGLLFNVLAYIPHSTITSHGRTDIFARLYWMELAIYVIAVVVLIAYFGIVGAAIAWSFRVALDAFIIMYFARRTSGVPFVFLRRWGVLSLALLTLLPCVLFVIRYDNFSPWVVVITAFCLATYSITIWFGYVELEERVWITTRVANYFGVSI
jgi:O-antigen/teichoic acid export membrane protein